MMQRKVALLLGFASLLALGTTVRADDFALTQTGAASTILAFSGFSTGGNVTVNGSNIVTGISKVPFNQLIVGSNTYVLTSGSLDLSGTTLTLDGAIPGLGINSSLALVTIQLGSSLINTGGASVLNVSINNATSITESAILLSDLGITGPVTSSLVGGGLIGTGGSGSFAVTSDTLAASVTPGAVPEPATLSLLGIGLAGIAWFARRRSAQRL